MGRKVAVVAAAVAALTVASAGIGASANPLSRTEVTRDRFSEPISVVRVDNEVGSVTVVAGSRPGVTVTERWFLVEPDVDISLRGGVLDIVADCPDMGLSINDCSVDLELTVPPAAAANLATAVGDVTVTDLTGGQRLRTSSGRIEASGVGNPKAVIAATAATGEIVLESIKAATVEAETSSGDITVDAYDLRESLLARAGSGRIDIAVPSGAYALHLDAVSGRERVSGVTSDPTAARSITARTSSGSVEVRARGAAPAASPPPEPAPASRPTSTSTTTSTTAPRPPQDDDERGPGFPGWS